MRKILPDKLDPELLAELGTLIESDLTDEQKRKNLRAALAVAPSADGLDHQKLINLLMQTDQ